MSFTQTFFASFFVHFHPAIDAIDTFVAPPVTKRRSGYLAVSLARNCLIKRPFSRLCRMGQADDGMRFSQPFFYSAGCEAPVRILSLARWKTKRT
jgi:hypothetical protein